MDPQDLLLTAVRGTIIYFFTLLVIRLLGKREIGNIGAFDQSGLRREWLRSEDVRCLLRLNGQDQIEEVRSAQMEPSATLSVLLRDTAKPAQQCDLPKLKEAVR